MLQLIIISQKSSHEYFVVKASKLQFFIQDNVLSNIILWNTDLWLKNEVFLPIFYLLSQPNSIISSRQFISFFTWQVEFITMFRCFSFAGSDTLYVNDFQLYPNLVWSTTSFWETTLLHENFSPRWTIFFEDLLFQHCLICKFLPKSLN